MSFGFKSAARFVTTVPSPGSPPSTGLKLDAEVAELSIGTPSTMNSGWLLPTTVRMPRIWMNDEAPGSPDWPVTWTLGALAASASTMFDSLLLSICSAETVLRTLPSFSVAVAVPARAERHGLPRHAGARHEEGVAAVVSREGAQSHGRNRDLDGAQRHSGLARHSAGERDRLLRAEPERRRAERGKQNENESTAANAHVPSSIRVR